MGIVLHPELTPNEILNHRCVPASRGVASVLWTPFDPLGELLTLGFGEFAGSPWRGFVNQAGHALEEELVSVVPNGLLTESHHVGQGGSETQPRARFGLERGPAKRGCV